MTTEKMLNEDRARFQRCDIELFNVMMIVCERLVSWDVKAKLSSNMSVDPESV